MTHILQTFKDKKIAVLGSGEEGRAVRRFLRAQKIPSVVLDESTGGESAFDKLTDYDIVFRSPGISSFRPELLNAQRQGVVVLSQTSLFFALASCPIIGITGTKGKGTTSSLLHAMLSLAFRKKRIYLTGNIGNNPPLGLLDKLKRTDLVIFELSSFQLEDMTVSPHIAVVLMTAPDHLDYHKSLSAYVSAKANIARFQNKNDFVIYNDDYPLSRRIAHSGAARKIAFSIKQPKPEEKQNLQQLFSVSPILGKHNFENIAAARAVASLLGVSSGIQKKALIGFKSLPHRLQFVVKRKGVTFYNDSAATVPEPTLAAVNSFHEPIILILGGQGKGVNYGGFAKKLARLSHLKAIVLLGKNIRELKNSLIKAGFKGKLDVVSGSMAAVFVKLEKLAAPGAFQHIGILSLEFHVDKLSRPLL